MNRQEKVFQIRETIGAMDASHIVDSIAGTGSAYIERKIYFPYFWFSADCAMRTLFGKRSFSADCLVDACNGLGATADPFPVDESSVPADAILDSRIYSEAAKKAAQRFVTHNLGRRLKMIGQFNVALKARGMIYKSYYLVRCEGTLVMVDSTTGCIHTLAERTA